MSTRGKCLTVCVAVGALLFLGGDPGGGRGIVWAAPDPECEEGCISSQCFEELGKDGKTKGYITFVYSKVQTNQARDARAQKGLTSGKLEPWLDAQKNQLNFDRFVVKTCNCPCGATAAKTAHATNPSPNLGPDMNNLTEKAFFCLQK